MQPADVSATPTISYQRSYTKIETLHCKNPTETHDALSEVYDDLTVDRSTVSRWDDRFHGGCTSIGNDPGTGRPSISTDERSVKLVHMKIVLQHVKHFLVHGCARVAHCVTAR